MCSKKGKPVSSLHWPVPSRLTVARICVSSVLRVTLALRWLMNNLHWEKSVSDGQKGLTVTNRAAIIRAARAADQHSRSINAIGTPETTRETAMPLEIRSFPLDQAHLDELAGVLRQDEAIAGTLAALPGSPCHQLSV